MSSKTTQPTAAIRDRETDAAVEQLRGEVRDLEDDVRRLHEQLARMHARLVPEPGAEELDISQLELAPPRPPRPLFERLVRKLARSAARFIRGAIRALSPSHDPIHRLRLVAGRHAAGTLPSIGAGDDVDLIVDSPARLSEGRLSDLQLLFASEMIDAACLGCATIRRRTMPAWTGRDDLDGLHRAAIALRRAVVVKDLDMRPASTSDLGLRPAGLGGASHCWRGGPYLVAMPKDQRVAELPVCADLPPADLIPVVGGLLIVIDQPLVNGLERRVGAILEATPNRRGATIVSLAASGQPGGRRLDLLDGPDCRTMSLGATVNSTLFGAIASRIVQTGSFTDLWAIGEGPVLQRFVVSCAAASSTLRVIWEPLREPQQRFAQAAVTVARTAEDRRRWRARWPEHEVVLVPTPAGPTESFVPPAETSRRLPGTRVVLFADDLSPESRPEAVSYTHLTLPTN